MSHDFILNRGYLENIKCLLKSYKSIDNSTHKELTMVSKHYIMITHN